MKITQDTLRKIIREELSEITQLPTDLDVPASEAELAMDALSAEYEEAAKRSWFRTARVIDPFSDRSRRFPGAAWQPGDKRRCYAGRSRQGR